MSAATDAVAIEIEVSASGALAAYLPDGAAGGRARVSLAPDSSVADLLERLGVAPERALLVIVDGALVAPAARAVTALADGAHLVLAAPIRAG